MHLRALTGQPIGVKRVGLVLQGVQPIKRIFGTNQEALASQRSHRGSWGTFGLDAPYEAHVAG